MAGRPLKFDAAYYLSCIYWLPCGHLDGNQHNRLHLARFGQAFCETCQQWVGETEVGENA